MLSNLIKMTTAVFIVLLGSLFSCKKEKLDLNASPVSSFTTDTTMCELKKNSIIYGAGKYSAFSDLIKWSNKWYVVFRSAESHAYTKDGILEVLESEDFITWKVVNSFKYDGMDLRDPKFCIFGSDLLINTQGVTFNPDRSVSSQTGLTFNLTKSLKSHSLENTKQIPLVMNYTFPGYWPWRYTKYQNSFYSWGYNVEAGIFRLVKTSDFIKVDELLNLDKLQNKPSEATIRIANNKFYSLIRRAGATLFGIANIDDPTNIEWTELPIQGLGGPNFVFYDNETVVFGGRDLSTSVSSFENNRTSLYVYKISSKKLYKVITLPSYGDTGYPGLVLEGKNLFLTYHSSHEGKAKIYSAQVELKIRN